MNAEHRIKDLKQKIQKLEEKLSATTIGEAERVAIRKHITATLNLTELRRTYNAQTNGKFAI
jgi:hypothetical protein